QDWCSPRLPFRARRPFDSPRHLAPGGCVRRLPSWLRNRILIHAALTKPGQHAANKMNMERRNPHSVDIDLFPTERILKIINAEDALVANAVAAAIPQIGKVVDSAIESIRSGGRVIYVGAGTSGRLAVIDAAECPPTFSAPPEWVQAVMAGG